MTLTEYTSKLFELSSEVLLLRSKISGAEFMLKMNKNMGLTKLNGIISDVDTLLGNFNNIRKDIENDSMHDINKNSMFDQIDKLTKDAIAVKTAVLNVIKKNQ